MFPVPADNLLLFHGILLVVVALPLALACMLAVEPLRKLTGRLAPWSALPAALLAVASRPGYVETFDWLLLGTRLALDEVARVFLFFVATVWFVAGIFSRRTVAQAPKASRFYAFYLLTLAGNLGVVLARDLPSFLFFYSLMGLSSYGLVVHREDQGATRAARIYMALLIVGEGLLYAAAVLVAADATSYDAAAIRRALAASEHQGLIGALFLVGFGLKAGFVFLHVSLPPAYEAAPASAGAVLSGAMSKAGILGWLLFLPLGLGSMPTLGWLFLAGGIFGAYYGAIVGLFQQSPKAMLAYSSVSQIGFMTLLVGVGLLNPALWQAALLACVIYALHHGLSKGILFLGAGICEEGVLSDRARRFVLLGLILPSLALAGAPLTGGAIAKHGLVESLHGGGLPVGDWFEYLVKFAAVGTAVLLARFIVAARRQALSDNGRSVPRRGLWMPWAALLVVMIVAPWFFPWEQMVELSRETLVVDVIIGELWPLGIAGVLIALGEWSFRRFGWSVPRVPAGDVLVPTLRLLGLVGEELDRAALWIAHHWERASRAGRAQLGRLRGVIGQVESAEDVLRSWHVGAALFLVLVVALLALVWL